MPELTKELIDFYESLENISSIDIWDIQSNIRPTEKIEDECREKLLVERKVLFLNLNDGQLLQNIQVTDIQGQPTKSVFSEKDIEYLKDRVNVTSNPWLKSRYAHILWQEKRHNDYAEQAIDSYIRTIENTNPNELHELPNVLAAVVFISVKSKKGKKKIEDLILSLINEKPIWIKANILSSVLRIKFLVRTHLIEIANSIPKWIEQDTDKSYHATKLFLEQGLVLYHKLGLAEDKLNELLAANEDIILDQHQDESDFVRYITIGQKAYYLKLANKTKESEVLFAEYNRLKQKVKLHQISVELADDETKMFNDYLNLKSKLILDLPTDSILAFFALDDGILVDPEENEQNAQNVIKNSVLHLFSTSVFDINSNFKNLSESEKIDSQIIQNYTISHGIRCHSLFMKVFIDGIIAGKLNYYKVYKFFENQTWYTMKFKRTITDNEIDRNSSWLTMLAPAIHNLLAQFELSVLMKTNKINNFILAIDSMTIKFEGALRDFIRLCGGNTTTIIKGELREQLLEELLENQITKKYFNNRDIELFKYTFTKKGKNLRNDVAHSFMEFSDYTWEAAVLVFLCILRLGKYTLVETQVENR
jgi:hypothetical protein